MEFTKQQLIKYAQDKAIVQDAEVFDQINTKNISSCIDATSTLLELLKKYQILADDAIGSGTLYRDLAKKYRSDEYDPISSKSWASVGLSGIEHAKFDDEEESLVDFKRDREIADQCQDQYETSMKAIHNIFRQSTNCFGKLKRDLQALINDCTAFRDTTNENIQNFID